MTLHEQYLQWAGLPPEAAGAISDWEMVPLEVDGRLIAIGALHGTELHFAADPTMRGLVVTRRRAQGFLNPLLERRSFLTTRVHHSTPQAARFVERMGFEETAETADCRHYMLAGAPFARAEKRI